MKSMTALLADQRFDLAPLMKMVYLPATSPKQGLTKQQYNKTRSQTLPKQLERENIQSVVGSMLPCSSIGKLDLSMDRSSLSLWLLRVSSKRCSHSNRYSLQYSMQSTSATSFTQIHPLHTPHTSTPTPYSSHQHTHSILLTPAHPLHPSH